MKSITRNQLILIAAVVVVLLLSIVLLIFNLQAQGYRAAVARDIQETEDSIAWMKQHYDTDLLERELAAAQEELADAPIPKEDAIDNPEMYDDIFVAAVSAKVHNDYDYEYNGATSTEIGESSYQALTWEITVTAKLSRIIEFIHLLEEMDYDTLRITEVEFDAGDEDMWDASFNIEIIIQEEAD